MTSTTNLIGEFTAGSDTFNLLGTDRATASNFYFRAGDWVQLGTQGYVYKVVRDAPVPDNQIRIHRPIIESSVNANNDTVVVGPNINMRVKCINFPTWSLFGYNQIAWNGDFVFVEVIE